MQPAEVEQRGFAILPEVSTRGEIRRLDESLTRNPLPRSRAGMRRALKYPAVLAIARDPRLRAVAQEVLGCDPLPFRATLFDKSPVSKWLVVWHQDTALPLRKRSELPEWGAVVSKRWSSLRARASECTFLRRRVASASR
jgi:hypothetical protein